MKARINMHTCTYIHTHLTNIGIHSCSLMLTHITHEYTFTCTCTHTHIHTHRTYIQIHESIWARTKPTHKRVGNHSQTHIHNTFIQEHACALIHSLHRYCLHTTSPQTHVS